MKCDWLYRNKKKWLLRRVSVHENVRALSWLEIPRRIYLIGGRRPVHLLPLAALDYISVQCYRNNSSTTPYPITTAAMKLSWGAALSSLFCAATSASKVAHVFVSDPTSRGAVQPQTVSPETARLILAQRLGLSRFHSIPDVKPEVIQQINAFGGRPQKFFGAQNAADWIDAQLLVWAEDVEDVRGRYRTRKLCKEI